MCDFLALNEAQHIADFETWHNPVGSTGQGYCKGACHISQMKHRTRMHINSVRPVTHFRHHIKRVENEVVVTQHHPFGPAGGTPGIEKSGELLSAFAEIP